MNIILTSTDTTLRNVFKSESFRNVNYDTIYPNNSIDWVLRMKTVPNVGDYVYFHGDYYEQLPTKVVRVSKDVSGNAIVYFEPAKLCDIDSYMYSEIGYGVQFIRDVKNAYSDTYIQKTVKHKLVELKEMYGEDPNELGVYVTEICNYLGLFDCTVIDTTNVTYAVSDIISSAMPDKYKWHRPGRHEYSDY